LRTVGLTGGIGSGKSIVARILEAMGFPVYYSDLRAKQLTDTEPSIREGLISLVGPDVYENGSLNRSFLAEKIFNDDSLRVQVNELIHPAVRRDFDQWKNEQEGVLVFNEAAILFETGAYTRFNKNVLITAPVELRIKRVMNRDFTKRMEVESRISKQWPDDKKIPLADFVITNDDRQPLLTQVEKMIKELS
jgi:dephospho-CoA kinase